MLKDKSCLRVGILGCGPISQFAHLESAQKARNVILQAVCDADESLAQRFGKFYDAERIYLDYDEMLADPNVDAIIVATSDPFHVPASIKALAAGKHVLCEKPIGVSIQEVENLARQVTASGLVLQVGHMLRFDPGIQASNCHFTRPLMPDNQKRPPAERTSARLHHLHRPSISEAVAFAAFWDVTLRSEARPSSVIT